MEKSTSFKIYLLFCFLHLNLRPSLATECAPNLNVTCDIAISWFESNNNATFDLLVKNFPKSLYSSAHLPNLQDYKERASKIKWVLKSSMRFDSHLGLAYSQSRLSNAHQNNNKTGLVSFDPLQFDGCEEFLKEVAAQPWKHAPAGSPNESEKSQFCRNPQELSIMIPTMVRWFNSETEVLLVGKETGRSTQYNCFVSERDLNNDQLCNFLAEY